MALSVQILYPLCKRFVKASTGPSPDPCRESAVTARNPIMNVAPFVLNALDHLDQGISVIDGDLRMIMWNRHMVDLLGFPASLMRAGVPLETLIRFNAERGEYGPGNPERLVRERMDLARQFRAHCFERTRPDGTIIEVKGHPLADGGFVTVYSDVTRRREDERALQQNAVELERRVQERTASLNDLNRNLREEIDAHRKTTQALRESGQWMRTITDSIPVLIAYLDPALECRFANQRAVEWFGDAASESAGRDAAISRRQAFVDQIKPLAQHALSGHAASTEVSFSDRRGNSRIAAVDLVPHRAPDDASRVQGLFLLAQDITDIKSTQEALLESSKLNAVGQLTGALAHDFGNMLAIVKGNLSFIQQLAGDVDDDLAESLVSCLRTVDRGADLTRRLLAFARRQSLKPQPIDVGGMLEDLRALTRHPLGEEIRLNVRVASDIARLRADPSGLENTLLNLVFNARDAMSNGGAIRIDASNCRVDGPARGRPPLVPGAYVRLRVSDNGDGIDAGDLPHVMEPFFTTKRPGAGTGLGLSTVYGFVKQSQGDIRIESRRGRGTRVDIYLPAANDDTVTTAVP